MARIVLVLLSLFDDLMRASAPRSIPPVRPAITEPLERKPPLKPDPQPEDEPMSARRCSVCSQDWPTAAKYMTCPLCEGETSYTASRQAMTKEEALALAPEIADKLPDLNDKQRAELDADWAWLKVEVERRGGRWSIADLIEEGVPRKEAA